MSFTALRGWNFHVDTFDTIEQFFNPSLNPNYNLTRSCTVSQLITGLNKIFSNRQWLADQLTRQEDDAFDHAKDLFTALANDSRIHNLTLATIMWEWNTIYDDDADESNIDHDTILLTLWKLRNTSNAGFYETVRCDFDSMSMSEMVDAVVACQNNALSHNLLDLPADFGQMVIDPLMFISIPGTYPMLIWNYHFGRVYYRETFIFEGIRSPTNRTAATAAIVAAEWRNGHSIDVDYYDYMTIHWLVPTQTGDRRALHRQHSYSTKVGTLIGGVLRQSNELADPLYGVELEVSSNLTIPTIVDAPEKTYCMVKQDSSITGNQRYMYEIVSVPATIKVHAKSWAQIFEKVGYHNFDVTKQTNNGMHVHIDMNAFNNHQGHPDSLHLKHFCWFFINPVNAQFQLEISERTEETMNKYAYGPKVHHTTLPSMFKSTLDYTAPPFRGIVHFKQDRDSGRTVTLECRMFKGIPSLGAILKNLEYIDSVFDFTRKVCFSSNTVNNYLSYLDSTPSNRYTTLKEFINRTNSTELREAASITQLLFGQSDPHKMLATIDKHNISITQHNIHVLDRILPGVKFGFNKYGQVIVVETNRARLYDMDLSLQQKLTRFKGNKANVSHTNP